MTITFLGSLLINVPCHMSKRRDLKVWTPNTASVYTIYGNIIKGPSWHHRTSYLCNDNVPGIAQCALFYMTGSFSLSSHLSFRNLNKGS